MHNFHNYINGMYMPTSHELTFENINPADRDDIIGTFPLSSIDDVNLAVDARADNTNKSLDIFVQGTSGATFSWLACVKTYEVIE